MEDLKEELKKFEICLENYCPTLFKRLQQPISLIGLTKIKDNQLLELLSWKNGIDYDVELPTNAFDFCGFGVVPSLQFVYKVLEIKEITCYWKPSYFPVIASFAGDYLLFESNKNSIDYGLIYLYSPNLGYVYELTSIYDSLLLMFKTIRVCFEKKAHIYNMVENRLETDYELYFSISSFLNPLSEFWK